MNNASRSTVAVTLLCAFVSTSVLAQYDAPSTYYGSVTTQTGTLLKDRLQAIMSAGHVQTSYQQARDYLPITDANPANQSQMFEFYSRATIQKSSATAQGFVGLYESREHVWPDSLQGPGDTSNSTRGSRGDLHMLKPLSQSINSSRGNKPFGSATLSGSHRSAGSYYFPGDADKGDAARILLYAATRWQSGAGGGTTSLSLVNGLPTNDSQMGDLNSLLHYHYLDTPDLFERRRNDVIYRGDDAQTSNDDVASWSGTNNRNAYIDRPEYAWSVFADQRNDTKLTLGAATAEGSSIMTVNFGRVLRGASVPSAKTITLNKTGIDGTYYSVTTGGDATSNVAGRYNAFAMDAAASRTITVGLDTTTATAGLKTGTVTVDNLDVTTEGGTGVGARDGNDVATIALSVVAPSNPSFAADTDTNALTIDFGTLQLGSANAQQSFAIHNLRDALGADLTAGLDLDNIVVSGGSTPFSLSLDRFSAIAADEEMPALALLNTDLAGAFVATYLLSFSDENLPGTQSATAMTLTLRAAVVVPEPTGIVAFTSIVVSLVRRRRFERPALRRVRL